MEMSDKHGAVTSTFDSFQIDAGLVATPVRIADAESAGLLRPGDVVDVLAAAGTPEGGSGEARLVAAAVRVLSAPRPADAGLSAGTLGDGALLLLATTSPTASPSAVSTAEPIRSKS